MHHNTVNITGKKFGRLLVVRYAGRVAFGKNPDKTVAQWVCACDCGSEHVTTGNSLRTGRVMSCGCARVPPMVGKRFGRLVVLSQTPRGNNAHSKWLCECDCGKRKAVLGAALRNGMTKSCGCLRRELNRAKFTVDMLGQRFGKLVVLERTDSKPGRWLAKWKCQCDCGRVAVLTGNALRCGGTQSCGCLQRKHGMARTREYRIWRGMKSRCLDPLGSGYERYGAKGVKVHPAWVEDFAEFYKHVGPMPSPKHSLDRFPDPKGDYVPGNVRWATATEQARNRASTKRLTFRGETLPMAEWADRFGLASGTVSARIQRGWAVEKALTTPLLQASRAPIEGPHLTATSPAGS